MPIQRFVSPGATRMGFDHLRANAVSRFVSMAQRRRSLPQVEGLEERRLLSRAISPTFPGHDSQPGRVSALIRPGATEAKPLKALSLNGSVHGKFTQHGQVGKFSGSGRIGSLGVVQVTVSETFDSQREITGGTANLHNTRGSVHLTILPGGTGFKVVSGNKAFSSASGAGTFSLAIVKRAATATFHANPAVPANLLYTWHEIDGQNVTGSIQVSSRALAAQQIQLSDVISFTFSVGSYTFTAAGLNAPDFPIPILAPSGSFSTMVAKNPGNTFNEVLNRGTPQIVSLELRDNAESMAYSGERWLLQSFAGPPVVGIGYWTVSAG